MTRALSEQEIVRRESLQKLRDLGIDPYPAHMFNVDCTSKQVKENYKEGEDLKLDSWLTKIEEELVNDGIKIFLERKKFIEKFNSLPIHSKSFPNIKLFLHGNIEKIFCEKIDFCQNLKFREF